MRLSEALKILGPLTVMWKRKRKLEAEAPETAILYGSGSGSGSGLFGSPFRGKSDLKWQANSDHSSQY